MTKSERDAMIAKVRSNFKELSLRLGALNSQYQQFKASVAELRKKK